MFFNSLLGKGCYEGGLCEGHCDKLINNTIGNCYFHCKSNNYSEGGCADTEEFYFALQVTKKLVIAFAL